MSDTHNLEPDYGTGKKNLTIYLVGFITCIVLTLIPFELTSHFSSQIEKGIATSLSSALLLIILFLCAITQFIVQVLCFLRLSAETIQGKTNIMCFIFSIVIVFVVVGGSVWIMYHLNYNMMH
jgi:cytochrome o ubiquinol oxidase subunit IV